VLFFIPTREFYLVRHPYNKWFRLGCMYSECAVLQTDLPYACESYSLAGKVRYLNRCSFINIIKLEDIKDIYKIIQAVLVNDRSI